MISKALIRRKRSKTDSFNGEVTLTNRADITRVFGPRYHLIQPLRS